MKTKKPILLRLTINQRNSLAARQYTIFDIEPSFFTLSNKEKKDFINKEKLKIKELLTDAFQHYFH